MIGGMTPGGGMMPAGYSAMAMPTFGQAPCAGFGTMPTLPGAMGGAFGGAGMMGTGTGPGMMGMMGGIAAASPGMWAAAPTGTGAGAGLPGGGVTGPAAGAAPERGASANDAATMQTAWATSAVRTTNAAAELRKLMSAARSLGKPGGAAGQGGHAASSSSSSPMPFPCMVGNMATTTGAGSTFPSGNAAAAATAQSHPSFQLQNLAAVAHMQTAQMQQLAQSEEMQRMQIAMQMQMMAATELQSREETMKRDRPSSPSRDLQSLARKHQRRGDKESSEFFYDHHKAQEEKDEACVGTSEIVKKVKLIQRSSARGYNAWDTYCLSRGNKTKDPRLHHDDFLQGFFDAIGRGEFGDVPGAAEILGDSATRRGVPNTSTVVGDVGDEKPYPKAVFIAGLPKEVTEQELKDHFAAFGVVQAVRLNLDEDQTLRGTGEVEFVDEASAKKVLENFDHNVFQGRWLHCVVAKRKG